MTNCGLKVKITHCKGYSYESANDRIIGQIDCVRPEMVSFFVAKQRTPDGTRRDIDNRVGRARSNNSGRFDRKKRIDECR